MENNSVKKTNSMGVLSRHLTWINLVSDKNISALVDKVQPITKEEN
jgi:hypothetical protein